jgi:septal ring factor EnvC (AmiA/AmiB activator)
MPQAAMPQTQGTAYSPPPLGTYADSEPADWPPARRRSRLVPVLAVLSVLLLMAVLAMGAMFTTARGELQSTGAALAASERKSAVQAEQIAARDQSIAGLKGDVAKAKSELAGLKKELTGTKDQLGNTKTQLGDTQTQLGNTVDEKAVVSRCLKLILDFFDAAARGQNGKARALYQQANAPCEAADKIVNP